MCIRDRWCEIRHTDILVCSTSSLTTDLSPLSEAGAESVEAKGTLAQFQGLCDVMKLCKPDIVLYENMVQLDQKKKDGPSNYDILRKSWESMGYQVIKVFTDSKCFGLPQDRNRLWVVAYNIKNPRIITFETREWARVKKTFTSLFVVTQRKPACASQYLLPDESNEVKEELKSCQEIANKRKKEG